MNDPTGMENLDAFARLTLLRNAIANVSPGDAELDVIDEMLEQLRAKPYTLALVGEFNRGKSSLINALLGMPILPMDVTPTTAAINRIVYSNEPYALMRRKDGQEERIPMGALKAWVTKLDSASESAASQLLEAEIGYPTMFCKNNITILDTPGLNESENMSELTLQAARKSDALIYAMHANYPFSETEADAVCETLRDSAVQHVLFTVGFMDMIAEPDRERLLALFRKRIPQMTCARIDADDDLAPEEKERQKAILRDSAVLGVSAKKALEYFVTGNAEDLRVSGMETYKKELMTRLTAHQGEFMQQRVVPYLERTSATFNHAADTYFAALGEQATQGLKAIERTQALVERVNLRRSLLLDSCVQSLNGPFDTQEELETRLVNLVRVNMSGVIVTPVSAPTSANTLLGKLKSKVKETGVYREKNDPEQIRLNEGRKKARDYVALKWEQGAEENANRLLAHAAEVAADLRREVEQSFDDLYACMLPGERRAPFMDETGDSSVDGELPVYTFTEDIRNAVRTFPLEPEIPLGTVESVIQRGVKRYVNCYLSLVRSPLRKLADAAMTLKPDLLAQYSARLEELRARQAALAARHDELAAQRQVIASLLVPDPAPSGEDAPKADDSEPEATL